MEECGTWLESDRALILGRMSDGAEFSEICSPKSISESSMNPCERLTLGCTIASGAISRSLGV